VQIILSENIGLDGRGAYYDHYGALKDVYKIICSSSWHLLAWKSPEKLTGEYIRRERARVLEKVRAIDILRGQYDDYHTEANIPPTSTTEPLHSRISRSTILAGLAFLFI